MHGVAERRMLGDVVDQLAVKINGTAVFEDYVLRPVLQSPMLTPFEPVT